MNQLPVERIQLARQAFEQEKQDVLCEPTERVYRQPSELLIHTHDELVEREKQDRNVQKTRSVVVAGGSKHHSTARLENLQHVALAELKLPGVNRGKSLLLKISSKSCRTAALHVLAVDQAGWMVPLSIYHATENLEQLLQPGTILAVREPYLKSKPEGYFIRIDTPSDLNVWPAQSLFPRSFVNAPSSLDHFRSQGGTHFAKQQLHEATNAYEAGIWYFPGVQEVSVLRLNAAASYLKIGLPGHALRHLQACDRTTLTSLQLQKLGFRLLIALYELRRYDVAEELLLDMEDYEEPNILDIKTKIRARLRERAAGPATYDWPEIYRMAKVTGSVDVADWTGPVETRVRLGWGRGLCTTRDVAAGKLLLVAQPLAVVRPTSVPMNVLVGINLASLSADAPSQVDIVGRLIERASDDPLFAAKLQDIFAGPMFPMPGLPMTGNGDIASSPIDAGKIEGMVAYNSFKPESCTLDMLAGEETNVLLSPSGLYHLPSMVNHACLGNANYVFFGDLIVVRATKAINAGEEILFSYCDPAAPLEDRRQHLARYGFTCHCQLCFDDALDSPAQRMTRRALFERAIPSVSTATAVSQARKTVSQLTETYYESRQSPRPEMYRAYRQLSLASEGHGMKTEALEAQYDALRAIGAEISPTSTTAIGGSMLSRDPLVMLQDAIISCFDIAIRFHLAGDSESRGKWIDEGRRLHDREFGPGLLDLRMKGFANSLGWTGTWDLETQP